VSTRPRREKVGADDCPPAVSLVTLPRPDSGPAPLPGSERVWSLDRFEESLVRHTNTPALIHIFLHPSPSSSSPSPLPPSQLPLLTSLSHLGKRGVLIRRVGNTRPRECIISHLHPDMFYSSAALRPSLPPSLPPPHISFLLSQHKPTTPQTAHPEALLNHRPRREGQRGCGASSSRCPLP
jgi:hypothetical protein